MFKMFSSARFFRLQFYAHLIPVPCILYAQHFLSRSNSLIFFFLLQRYRFRLCPQIRCVSLRLSIVYSDLSKKYIRILYEVMPRPLSLTPSTVRNSLVFITLDVIQSVQRERQVIGKKTRLRTLSASY
jgi:hypothetical protein